MGISSELMNFTLSVFSFPWISAPSQGFFLKSASKAPIKGIVMALVFTLMNKHILVERIHQEFLVNPYVFLAHPISTI